MQEKHDGPQLESRILFEEASKLFEDDESLVDRDFI
jgi:hypothetical protein